MSLVRKSEFAEMRGVSPGRLSQWIAAGQIDGSAIVGEGQRALIDSDLACAQLRERLAVNERFGLNGLSTNLDGDAVRKGLAPLKESLAAGKVTARGGQLSLDGRPRTSRATGEDSVEAQIKAEKLRHARLMTSRLEEEDRQRRGFYVEAAAARAEMARLAADMLKSFEGLLPDFAGALAAEFGLPARDALRLLQADFRRAQARLSAAHAGAAAAIAPTLAAADEPAGA